MTRRDSSRGEPESGDYWPLSARSSEEISDLIANAITSAVSRTIRAPISGRIATLGDLGSRMKTIHEWERERNRRRNELTARVIAALATMPPRVARKYAIDVADSVISKWLSRFDGAQP